MRSLLQGATIAGWRPALASESASSGWVIPLGGRETANTAYARQYRQDVEGVQLGTDRRVDLGGGIARVGAVLTHAQGHVDYARGSGAIDLDSLALTARWSAANGGYVAGEVSGARALDRYEAADAQGVAVDGRFHARSLGARLEGGLPFDIGHGLSLEPSAAAAATLLLHDHDVTSAGVATEVSHAMLGQADVGITLRHTGAHDAFSHEVHARVARVQTFGDDLTVEASKDGGSVSAIAAPSRRGGSEAAVGGSLDFGPTKGLSLTFEVARQHLSASDATTGSTSASTWSGRLGVGYRW